jgi:hypothetical protein
MLMHMIATTLHCLPQAYTWSPIVQSTTSEETTRAQTRQCKRNRKTNRRGLRAVKADVVGKGLGLG